MTWNPRFVCYAKAHGRTPEAQVEHDDRVLNTPAFKGGFQGWIAKQKQAFYGKHPEAFFERNAHYICDFDAWDRWLEQAAEPKGEA